LSREVVRPLTVLPDVLLPGLDIVFCGTAAGAVSARKRAYYAGPGNAFWPTLVAVGLTPVAVAPHEFATLTRWRMGFTDLAKDVAGSDNMLGKRHFDVGRLTALILEYQPRIVAFTGKRAAIEFVGHGVDYGLLAQRIGETRFFVLPSPSGAARRHWNVDQWRELSRLRAAMADAGRQSPATGSIASPAVRP
jgi:TDG/mug DNA glycosylase family protein